MTPLLAASLEDIRRYERGALEAADALDRTPAPLTQIEEAVGLLPAQELFAAGVEMPPGIAAIAAKLAKKVMGGLAFAEKRVYINTADQALPRRRFVHGHELGHRVLPWQEQAYYADDDNTLDPQTRDALEWEANAFSAELLFGLDRFTKMADDWAPGIAVPLHLSGVFETSAHAALRRYVETSGHRVALLTLGRFPRHTKSERLPYLPVMADQCAESASFRDRFGAVTALAAKPLPLASIRHLPPRRRWPAPTSSKTATNSSLRPSGEPRTSRRRPSTTVGSTSSCSCNAGPSAVAAYGRPEAQSRQGIGDWPIHGACPARGSATGHRRGGIRQDASPTVTGGGLSSPVQGRQVSGATASARRC